MTTDKPASSEASIRTSTSPSRINVVGTSGCGKTHFASALAQRLQLPCIEMDAVFWEPAWTEPKDDVFLARLDAALASGRWVLDGNYTRTIPIKWRNVDMVIWLDYSFARTLCRAIKRALHRSLTRRELWPGTGNRESFRRLFSRDSIVLWTIRTHASSRARHEAVMRDNTYAHIRSVRLATPAAAQAFLNAL